MPTKQPKERERNQDREGSRHQKSSRSQKKASWSDEQLGSSPPSSNSRRRKDVVPELSRRGSLTASASPAGSRTSLPYPTFSKAHSKESVARDLKVDICTPDPTDLGSHDGGGKKPGLKANADGGGVREGGKNMGVTPPSPPLTSLSARPESQVAAEEKSRSSKEPGLESTSHVKRKSSSKQDDSKKPTPSSSSKKHTSKPSSKTGSVTRSTRSRSAHNAAATGSADNKEKHTSSLGRGKRVSSVRKGDEEGSTVASEATSTTETLQTLDRTMAQDLDRVSSSTACPPSHVRRTRNSSIDITKPSHIQERVVNISSVGANTLQCPEGSPLPPPPPPPPVVPINMPRVDYLLQNGGLAQPVSRRLLAACLPQHAPSQPTSIDGRLSYCEADNFAAEVGRLFAPYNELLHQYENVISHNGSLAVATGYRSVARRLLDRLETVFARDISSEACSCSMCWRQREEGDDEMGLGWGDVLEWVGGRKVLPPWPGFSFGQIGDMMSKLELQGRPDSAPRDMGNRSPKSILVDADVPAEFREHYKKQTKKTKAAVDQWLASQVTSPASPPQEVDDETLKFAILTHLEQSERSQFTELLAPSDNSDGGQDKTSPGQENPKSEVLVRTGVALQRLYRLAGPPRLPESAAFLVKNPSLHRVLATIAAITASEWDMLISGRFDGFLWSGAEDPFGGAQQPSRINTPWRNGSSGILNPLSRNATPFSAAGISGINGDGSRIATPFHVFPFAASRGATPAPGPPVSHDEEMEIAVLAEVEREIYVGMEALEDAFEALHHKAEVVRRALRERGAGLSMALQSRRFSPNGEGSMFEGVRGTPGPGLGFEQHGGAECDSEDESHWGARDGDVASEVWPDDSASNISTNRTRRPKRRTERRTPAPVEEADETEE